MNVRFFTIRSSVILTLCFLFVAPFLWSQSLADLAKEEKERRSSIKNKVRVVSNSTLGSYQKGSVSTGVYGESTADSEKKDKEGEAAKPKEEGKDKTPEEPVRDEKYWRDAYKLALDEAKAAENKRVLEELNLNTLWNQFYAEGDGFYRETIRKNISDKIEEIKKQKQTEEETKKALERLKEEARRNNVPPGWLR